MSFGTSKAALPSIARLLDDTPDDSLDISFNDIIDAPSLSKQPVFKPFRLYLGYESMTLALAYEIRSPGRRAGSKRIHTFSLANERKRGLSAQEAAFSMSKQFPQYLAPTAVSMQQLQRLIQRLFDQSNQLQQNDTSEDLNKVTEEELERRKREMEAAFEKNVVKPGDPGYVEDKREQFVPSESNEWDNEESIEIELETGADGQESDDEDDDLLF